MYIKTVADFRKAMRNGKYVWPGGYPTYFIMADGEALSFDAAKSEIRRILMAFQATKSGRYDNEWLPVSYEVNWEHGSLYCSHTGKKIEAAYN